MPDSKTFPPLGPQPGAAPHKRHNLHIQRYLITGLLTVFPL